MDIDLISKDTEELLVSSLRSAISDVNDGSDPNTALAKHATDNGLGPELGCRLVEAFNTSKTLNRLRNTTGEKRAESFAIADRDTVLALMYVPEKKAASRTVVRYQNPRAVNFNTRPTMHHEKAAADGRKTLGRMGGAADGPGGQCECPSCGTATPHKTGTPCTDVTCPSCGSKMARSVTKQSSVMSVGTEHTKTALYGIKSNAVVAGRSFLNAIGNARDEYRMLTKKAKEDISNSLEEFVSAFKRADRSTMSPLKDVEERLSYHFGPVAKQAMDLAWGRMDDHIRSREKRAEAVPESYVYPLDCELYKLGERLVRSIDEAAELHADFVKFDKRASLVENSFKQRVDTITKRGEPKKSISKRAAYDDDDDDDDKGKKKKEKWELSIGGLLELPKVEPVEIPSVMPAEHEGAMRSIKTKFMLNDFITNDPVISGYPVEDVMSAYNQLSGMVPALSTQPVAMRGLLATMLQREGGLEAMEVKTLLDTEEGKRELRILGE